MREHIALMGESFQTLFLVGVEECEKLVEVCESVFCAGGMFCFGRCLKGLSTCAREHKMMLPSVSLAWSLPAPGHQLPISSLMHDSRRQHDTCAELAVLRMKQITLISSKIGCSQQLLLHKLLSDEELNNCQCTQPACLQGCTAHPECSIRSRYMPRLVMQSSKSPVLQVL